MTYKVYIIIIHKEIILSFMLSYKQLLKIESRTLHITNLNISSKIKQLKAPLDIFFMLSPK